MLLLEDFLNMINSILPNLVYGIIVIYLSIVVTSLVICGFKDKPLAPKEIAETIDKKTNAVNVLLRKMLESSEVIQPETGKYTVMNEDNIPF